MYRSIVLLGCPGIGWHPTFCGPRQRPPHFSRALEGKKDRLAALLYYYWLIHTDWLTTNAVGEATYKSTNIIIYWIVLYCY